MSSGSVHEHLVLWLPGLNRRLPDWCKSYTDIGRYPALEWLCARARRSSGAAGGRGPSLDLDALLADAAGLRLLGAAGGGASADGRVPAGSDIDEAFWMCADPVHLQAGIEDLILRDAGEFELSEAEAADLVALINRHFDDRPWHLQMSSASEWHLRLSARAQLETTPLPRVMGQPINRWLPRGPDARAWLVDLTEIQMLLHDAPVNHAREARGLPVINSLWLWGQASLPAVPESGAHKAAGQICESLSNIHGKGLMMKGLALRHGLQLQAVPDDATSLLELMQAGKGGVRLVCVQALEAPAAHDDAHAWMQAMQVLENDWFMPLREAVASGACRSLTLLGDEGRQFFIDARARWRIWRRPGTLCSHVA